MKRINDELLLELYIKALKLNLDKDFILILEKELERRGLLFIIETDKDNKLLEN